MPPKKKNLKENNTDHYQSDELAKLGIFREDDKEDDESLK